MAGDGQSLTLSDVVTLQRGTTYKSALLGQAGPVLLGLASIQRNGGFRDDNLKTYGGDSPEKLTLRPGDIYVSLKDVTQSADLLGAIARVPSHIQTGRVTQDTVKLSFLRKDIPSRFIYWLLRTPFYREYCRAHAIGTTNLSLSRDDFLAFPVPKPKAKELTLVETLDALEDKIELNRRMNETLEALTQSLFKSWFVDATQAGLPKGWREGSILEVAKLLSGGTPKTERKDYWNGDILWASAKDVSQCGQAFLVTTDRTITKKGLEESATQLIPAFCTVVVARGATTGRMTMFGREIAMNQTCYALSSTTGTPFALYCLFRHVIDDLVQTAHGSVFDTITTSTFAASRLVLPPQQVYDSFEKAVSPIFARILSNIEESRTLGALRDTLLPKLLSGELRVPI
jgi:type I restriction enzyme S subunit